MTLVVDSSICLAWCFEDERTPLALSVADRIVDGHAWVPSLWRYELANGLLAAERRGRVSSAWRIAMMENFSALDIRCDRDADDHVFGATAQLADRYRLTVYDAAFLELAQRRRLPLATLDGALAQASKDAGVELLA